jgi:hypothetical protein
MYKLHDQPMGTLLAKSESALIALFNYCITRREISDWLILIKR